MSNLRPSGGRASGLQAAQAGLFAHYEALGTVLSPRERAFLVEFFERHLQDEHDDPAVAHWLGKGKR